MHWHEACDTDDRTSHNQEGGRDEFDLKTSRCPEVNIEQPDSQAQSIEPLPDGLPGKLVVDAPGGVEAEFIQTHISFLILNRDRVYKIRKSVRFPFLSFATRAERNEDCLREVRLNRRLAPDVYLGVAPLLERDDHFAVGDVGEELLQRRDGRDAPEHCVVMKRLRADGDAQSLLEAGRLSPEHIDAIADRIASFHAAHRLGTPVPYSPEAWLERVEAPFAESLESVVCNAEVPELIETAEQLLARVRTDASERRELLEVRRSEGRAVDGHGDLQLAHCWFDGAGVEPSIIDCTEFSEDFRHIDAASEVAFLAMDLRYRGHPELAERFLARYASCVDDFGIYSLVDFYASYRAAVRAKVAVLASIDANIEAKQRKAALGSAKAHLELAEKTLEPRQAGSITITCGTVGCGKSTVANAWAQATSGVVISSDRTRKHLAGIPADDHSGAAETSESGLYSRGRKEAVYSALLERADVVVRSGRHVMLDASFPRASQRQAVRRWAEERGISSRLVHIVCDADTARTRLAARERAGTDASDAGPSLYDWSVDNFEAPDEWPDSERSTISTDKSDWQDRVAEQLTTENKGSRRPH